MARHIVDDAADFAQHTFRPWMRRIEAAKQVRHLCQANSGVIQNPRFEQLVDARGSAALQHVDVDTGIENELRASRNR